MIPRTKNEDKIIKQLMKRTDKDVQIYLADLFKELANCYDFIRDKNEYQLFRGEIDGKRSLYFKLSDLMQEETSTKPMLASIKKKATKRA